MRLIELCELESYTVVLGLFSDGGSGRLSVGDGNTQDAARLSRKQCCSGALGNIIFGVLR